MNQRTRSLSRDLLLRKVRRGEMGMERLHLITHLCCQVSTMCHHSLAVVGREGHEEVTTALESS